MENIKGTEKILTADVNGCHIRLYFADQPVDGVLDRVRSVLSNTYDERIKEELGEIVGAGCQ